MKILRMIAVLLALGLMIGEAWRSWGADRPFIFVIDDFFLGIALLYGAWVMKMDSIRNRAIFAGAWAFNVGMLYGSFFGKIVDPSSSNPGNWDMGILTGLIGLAFATSVAGLVATIVLPAET